MPGDPFYRSKEWVKMRNKVRTKWLRDGKPCSFCGNHIVAGERTIVDHVFNRKLHPEKDPLDESLLVLCHHSCHSKKTEWVDYNKRIEVHSDGFPKDSEWS